MPRHAFVLTFRLPDRHADPISHADALFREGCGDATVCLRLGVLVLDFVREAETRRAAIASAAAAVMRAVPGAVPEGAAAEAMA